MTLTFKKDSYLKEDLGSYMKHQGRSVNLGRSHAPPNLPSHTHAQGVELFKFNFQPWQQNVINALERRKNIYVVASPGAGKTAPVCYWWAQNILNINPRMSQTNINDLMIRIREIITNPGSIPKILYLCPVRQLVYDIQKDFRRYFSEMFMYTLNIVQDKLITQNPTTQQLFLDFLERDIFLSYSNPRNPVIPIIRQRQRVYREYEHEQTFSTNKKRIDHLSREIQNLDNEIFDRLGDSIKLMIDRDLLHIRTAIDRAPNVSHTPPVTIAIYESGKDIFKNVSNNLRAIIIDEAHLIQERENSSNDRAKQITDNIYPIIKNIRNISNCQLILLSGTVNPTSAQNLCTFFNSCFHLNIEQVRGNTRNPSNVSVLPMDDLYKENKLVDILIRPKEEGNAIILFSKRKIDRIIDNALNQTQGIRRTAQQIDRGDLQKAKSPNMTIDLADYDQQSAKGAPNFSDKRIIDKINELPGAEHISDQRLLNCVMGGFAYIYRQDDKSKSDERNKKLGRDQQIVADLFSKGKIKSIIATDSIGIGININIKNMYVPSVSKFNGSGFETLPVSDASQLYNRVGRMAYQVSNIYTPEANMSDILNAISANNDKYDERSTLIKDIDQKMCQYMMHNNNLWIGAMRKLLT